MQENKPYLDFSDEDLLKIIDQDNYIELVTILFERYKEQIFGVTLKYLKMVPKAQDATMEIYQLLLRKLLSTEIKHFKPWLFVVTRNYCLDILRKKSRVEEKNKDYFFMQNEPVYHPYNEEDDEYERQLKKLNECLETLSPSQKKMITLFYLNKRSYKEITELENKTWKQVRSLIQNGRRNLKNCMNSK